MATCRAVILAAAVLGCAACRDPAPLASDPASPASGPPPARGPSSPTPDVASPRVTPEADAGLLPPWESLVRVRPALALRARTDVVVTEGGNRVEIGDEKRLSRTAAGDFELEMRRTHRGAAAGDTEESFHAVKVGDRYYTKGSGGPFVRWDDARDEPERAVRGAWADAASVVRLASECAVVRRDGTRAGLTSRGGGCRVPHTGTYPPATLLIRDVSGEVSWEGERPAGATVRLDLAVETSGKVADVTISHKVELSDLPATARVDEPKDATGSRRERPARMIRGVLGGLVAPE